MKTLYIFGLFLFVVLAQLFVPAKMIWDQNTILSHGEVYKLRTQPVDPTDPFRGKYITLRYDINSVQVKGTFWQRNDDVFVSLQRDSLGYAFIEKVSKETPKSLDGILKAKAVYFNKYNSELHLDFGCDRFYMEESKAPKAEEAYNLAQGDSMVYNTYALVYIKNGNAVLDNVIINEEPIANYVEN